MIPAQHLQEQQLPVFNSLKVFFDNNVYSLFGNEKQLILCSINHYIDYMDHASIQIVNFENFLNDFSCSLSRSSSSCNCLISLRLI